MSKTKLTDKETQLIASIPSTQKAVTILARFEERRIQAKADRIALGHELHIVRTKLAKVGQGGLFRSWLRSIGLNYDRAYAYIAVAGHGKRKIDGPCYQRKLSFQRFQTKLTLAETNTEKRAVLREFVAWIRKEFKID